METNVPFKIGDTLHLKFKLPKMDTSLRIVGKVVRTNEKSADLLPGIGIEFEHLSYEDKRVIEGYVIDEIADQL